MSPRFPTEHDTILVTTIVNCNVEADRVAIDGDVVDIVLDAFCSGFYPEVSAAIVEIGKLPPGNYTARLSQRVHEDSGAPYSMAYELTTLRFKVLPAASGDDLRDFFRIPAPGDTGVTVLAADVNVFERLIWSERAAHLGGGLTLSLESKSQGSRPILDMLHMPMASDPSAAASILYFGHTDRFGNTICCPYAPLVPAAQAYPARWLISSILPSAPYGSMSVTRTGPVRRNSYGIEYDAVLLSFRSLPAGYDRDYVFALNAGLVAMTPTFPPSWSLPSRFLPTQFPPPRRTGLVVEYVNTDDFPDAPGGHYFYSADAAEQAALDAGAMGRFRRTGGSFSSGGFVRVCRFFGSVSPGPNSHFFSADADECDALKAAQQVPRPAAQQQWNYEGSGFDVVVANPTSPRCGPGLAPVFRLYNNAFDSAGPRGWASNHRYTKNISGEVDTMVDLGWRSEGLVFCVPES